MHNYRINNKAIKIIACICLLFFRVTSQGQFQKSGVVIEGVKYWDSTLKEFVRYPYKNMTALVVLYKDSSVIEIVNRYVYVEANGKPITSTPKLQHYKFIDLRTRSFYEYATFSKDSLFKRKYTLPDSINFYGWNFYKYSRQISNKNVEYQSDTIIEGNVYKRIKSWEIIKRNEVEFEQQYIVYLSCDKKGTIFHFDRFFEEEQNLNCPIIMYEKIEPSTGFHSKGEIKYLDRKLTRKELRVFKAWQKNAKKYPVTGKEQVDYKNI